MRAAWRLGCCTDNSEGEFGLTRMCASPTVVAFLQQLFLASSHQIVLLLHGSHSVFGEGAVYAYDGSDHFVIHVQVINSLSRDIVNVVESGICG